MSLKQEYNRTIIQQWLQFLEQTDSAAFCLIAAAPNGQNIILDVQAMEKRELIIRLKEVANDLEQGTADKFFVATPGN